MRRRGIIAALAGIAGVLLRDYGQAQQGHDTTGSSRVADFRPGHIALHLEDFKDQDAILVVEGDGRKATLSAKEIMNSLLEVPTARFTGDL